MGEATKTAHGSDEPLRSAHEAVLAPALPVASWQAMWSVFRKDWRSEWRTRAAINAIALFAIAAPIALSFSVAGQKLPPEALAGMFWTTLLFAALVGLSRAWVKEEESGTVTLLRLSAAPQAVLWGKVLWNAVLLVATQAAAVPIFIVLLGAQVDKPGLLLCILLLSDLGLATASSLLGAMSSGARARGALFAAIAVPILLPLLVASASATSVAFGMRGDYGPALQAIVAYDVAMLAAAWMLFDFVWS
jgi:heme exporter protein B